MSDAAPEEAQPPSNREAAQQSRALDTLTDHVEEKELDASKVQKAIADIAASQRAERDAQRLRDKELAGVKLDQADIDLVATEFEVDRKVAERRLREHKGDIVGALESFL